MRALILACIGAAGCSAPSSPADRQAGLAVSGPRSPTDTIIRIPTGARVEPSGFITVEQAPPSPPGPPQSRRESELTFYAELAGITNEEAAKRLSEQRAVRPEFERLQRQLRANERRNFTDAELIHRPDWAYLLYFKRDPEATLAKYTRNPRFQARLARYTEEELRALAQPWIERFERDRLFTGYGINARHGRAEIDMVVSEEEYAAIAAANGWGPVPDYLLLKFYGAPVGPAVDPAIAGGIRIFPHSDRNLGATNQAALGGRIVLRDGCFLVAGKEGPDQLAYFAREVGLGLDPQGYLSLHTRTAVPRHLGRIGEQFTWSGPISIAEDAPMVARLRERCGGVPLMHVGIPESSAIFNARYGLPRAAPPPPRRVRPAEPPRNP